MKTTKMDADHDFSYDKARTVNTHFNLKRESNGLKVSVTETENGWVIETEMPEFMEQVFTNKYLEVMGDMLGDRLDPVLDEAVYQLNKSIVKELLFK